MLTRISSIHTGAYFPVLVQDLKCLLEVGQNRTWEIY